MSDSNNSKSEIIHLRSEIVWRFGLIWTLVVLMTLVVATSSVDMSELEGAKISLKLTFGLVLMAASSIVLVVELLARKYDWLGGVLNVE